MNIHRTLKRAGLRSTRARVLVLEFFQQHAHDHLSADRVYSLLNEEIRNVSLSTVYRVLNELTDAKLLSGLVFGGGHMAYELNDGARHDHIVCTVCGSIREFFDPEIEARQQAVAEDLDFSVSGRQLVVFGLCAECRDRGAHVKRAIPSSIAR
ncbi:Fur family transcriptional regulator, ferric uptake regulator [Paraburkholderia fungorum]|uniref:Ferric uptake regulation protein n=1 Tax=Paraburkholderia fungorum TaxID=134537 RepID=A0A1H1JK23_9BURK|nr:Fur family transcriptional regulator [Paraburkholderia fungorum]SDR50343.1 Fur family transcriptional regulator, ferric uptake regulator [Paraburkholderia fungorum]